MHLQFQTTLQKTFPAERRVLAFRCAAYLGFWSLHSCPLSLRDVMVYSGVITGDNVSRNRSPLFDVVSKVFHTQQDGLLSDLPSRDEELTFRQPLGTLIRYSDMCRNVRSCVDPITG